MNRCKDCKYFKLKTEMFFPKSYGTCHCKKYVYAGDWGANFANVKRKDLFFYKDFEGYCADFRVGEEFGCVHWTKKEGKQ